MERSISRTRLATRRGVFATASLVLVAGLVVATSAATVSAQPGPRMTAKQLRALKDVLRTTRFWTKASKPRRARGQRIAVRAREFRSVRLETALLKSVLAGAPRERTNAARTNPLVVSLPAPNGTFHRFVLEESAVMAPALAKLHPEIKTYSGRGITDLAATIHADVSPLGFHASVRSPRGAWYIDPFYVGRNQTVHASYYGRDAQDAHGPFVERDASAAELSVDKGYYHAVDAVELHGSGFGANATITITISDPEGRSDPRSVTSTSDGLGGFTTGFEADPNGNLGTRIVVATDGDDSASTGYQVVRDDDPTSDPPTGPDLRTYRLALITDPGYATFHGGPANVTAAKVALMNRVNQVYEDDLTIRMQLVGANDLLNFDTWEKAIGPNGPCGAAGCFTLPQVTGCSNLGRNRIVISQIIGASNYDIGHLALGQPGGGVANLGVVGRQNKAGGCTGIPTPIGDFYAVDYVAHEMGHQFSGNHTFNGNQLNCAGGNRSAATSVEPGSGSSVMAYAGICLTDDLQPHSDPYFSQRSQQEITTYVASPQAAISDTHTVSLRHFGGGNEQQVVTFGPGYAPANAITALSVNINAAPSATSRGGAMEVGNTATIATATPHTVQVGEIVTIAGVAAAGYNGTFTVTAVPTTRSFQYANPVAGLPVSGGGTVTPAEPGAQESGNTVTIRTTTPHNRSVGDNVTIAGLGGAAAGYNGAFVVSNVLGPRQLQYVNPVAGLPNAGGGSVTFFSPFRVRIGGNDSAVVGGSGLAYSNANLTTAINAIPGFAGTATVTGAASTGFTVTYTGASAELDVPSIQLVDLSCAGCFASVEETNHGGPFDSFHLNYDGNLSAPIVNGTNYTAEAIQTALQGPTEVQAVALAGFDTNGDSYTLNYNGADTVPITRGQNNTQAGIAAALQGGNEQQQLTLTGFNAATPGHSFQVQIGGANSAVIGNGGVALTNATVAAAINAIPGFAGTVSAASSGNGGFTLTFAGASANTDVPSISIVNLGCAPACTATVRELVKGTGPVAGWPAGGTVAVGTVTDAGYTLTFGGTHQGTDVSLVTVTNGTGGVTGTATETAKGGPGIIPPTGTATVAGFGNLALANTGFQVTYGGSLAGTNLPVTLGTQDYTPGASGFTGETDKGGAVDNGGTVTATGNTWPTITVPAGYTIPLRTPFALTASAVDAEGDTILYAWEQNDRGGTAGTSLLNNVKPDGPLFAMFPLSAPISETDTLFYNSPNENHVTTSPTRVFPDLEQILANNTNADSGACGPGPIAPPVPIPVKECYSEFLPTADYVGSAVGGNAGPPPTLHFRATARDVRLGGGGNSAADLTLTLAPNAGPFLVTAPNSAVTYPGGSSQTVTWNPANTDVAPVETTHVKISLSTDGGRTYPHVLAASTTNDGSEGVTIPNLATDKARVKVEALGNVFFDVSNADFTVTDNANPTITASASPAPNAAGWNSSDVTVTLTADDGDGTVKSITYSATGAQPIPSTTVNASTASVVISSEGVTTLSFFATDTAGNSSAIGTLTVRLDKTAPEAFLRFDPTDRDIVAFARDALSGITSSELIPSAVTDLPTRDRHARTERRTYDLVDRAGNTLRLVDVVRIDKSDATARIETLRYKGGAVLTPSLNMILVDWKLQKSSLKELDQGFLVVSPLQAASTRWSAKDGRTHLVTLIGGAISKTTVPGMLLPRLATDEGELTLETTP